MLDTTGRPPRSGVGAVPLALAATILVLLFGGYFATLQNVWIDESTQLLGSGLPFGRMIRWLAGNYEPLGVPADRMPPGSYVIDWLCAHSVCTSPLQFRLVHLAAFAGGAFLTTWVAGKRYGAVAGVVTGLFLALLPQAGLVGAEIRAYPIFFLLTSVQLAVLCWLFDKHDLQWSGVLGFGAIGLATTYTHFFGLISTSALFFGLFVSQVRSRQCILIVGGSWAVFLLLSLGLAPFIGGARTISDTALVPHTSLASIAAYLSRIVGSAPMLLVPWVAAVFFACFALLLVAVTLLFGRLAMRSPFGSPMDFPVALILALLSGVVVTILAAFAVHGFDPMKPSYSIWMVPLVALLVGIAASEARALAGLAAVMLVALLVVQAEFIANAGLFVHGPERAIDAAIDGDPRGTAIIYDRPEWAYGYFPLVYRHGAALDQYFVKDGALRKIGWNGDQNTPALPPTALGGYRRLILATITSQSGNELRKSKRGQITPGLSSPPRIDPAMIGGGAWHQTGAFVRPGLYWLQLTRLEK